MKILIIGCGRVGARLAVRLEKNGHEIAVIEESREALAKLGGGFRGATYQGSGLDWELLKRVKATSFDTILALTGGDNRNLLITQTLRHQCPQARVLARLKDPVRAAIYHEMGIETLCTTTVVEGILEIWTQNGQMPVLPGEMAASGDKSELSD